MSAVRVAVAAGLAGAIALVVAFMPDLLGGFEREPVPAIELRDTDRDRSPERPSRERRAPPPPAPPSDDDDHDDDDDSCARSVAPAPGSWRRT